MSWLNLGADIENLFGSLVIATAQEGEEGGGRKIVSGYHIHKHIRMVRTKPDLRSDALAMLAKKVPAKTVLGKLGIDKTTLERWKREQATTWLLRGVEAGLVASKLGCKLGTVQRWEMELAQ